MTLKRPLIKFFKICLTYHPKRVIIDAYIERREEIKVENFKDLEKLLTIANKLKVQYNKLDYDKFVDERDVGGIDGFDTGYSCHISKHRDGSGTSIDLSGCYLGGEMFDAVKSLIEQQYGKVKEAIKNLGVDVSSMNLEINK